MRIELAWEDPANAPTYFASYDHNEPSKHDYDIDACSAGTWNSNAHPVGDDADPNASGESSSQDSSGATSAVLSRPKSRGSIAPYLNHYLACVNPPPKSAARNSNDGYSINSGFQTVPKQVISLIPWRVSESLPKQSACDGTPIIGAGIGMLENRNW